jgi:peptide chain release factor 2
MLRDRRRLEEEIELASRLDREVADLGALFELATEGEDVGRELNQGLKAFGEELRAIELRQLLGRDVDRANAFLAIHPGEGGTESQDWAEMLSRQYLRFCERKGFKTQIVDSLPGEEAGIKSMLLSVEGDYAYGLLAPETGVHRLVRISPFDAAKRRHTSFASVFVYPEADEIEIEVKPEELRIDTYRSSGAGGQHVNVTDSAVRLTHLPSGIVVQCQNERSQHRNRESAMRVLKARLYEVKLKEQEDKLAAQTGEKRAIGFGSQIRSYVLHPYKQVKDVRTGVEITDPDRVLDGDLDELIRAFLVQRKTGAGKRKD